MTASLESDGIPAEPPPPPSRLRLRRPLVWLDLETTGLSVEHDRIVEISALKEWPDGRLEERTRRLDPGIPIPAEVSRIHGLRDEDVRGQPRFENLARGLAEFLDGSDLAGFGIARFDVPLLEREFHRAGVPFSLEGRAVLDAKEIFHRHEPRGLAAACRFYLDHEFPVSHAAGSDVRVARAILLAQLTRYPHLPEDPQRLAAQLEGHRAENGVKLVCRGEESYLNFGKHRGRNLRDVARSEPDYLRWMLEQGFPAEVNERVQRALAG